MPDSSKSCNKVQLSIHEALSPGLQDSLHLDTARAFYSANIDFSVANNPEFIRWVKALARSNLPDYNPLTRSCLGAGSKWLGEVEKE